MTHTGKVLSTHADGSHESLWESYNLVLLPENLPDPDNNDNMGLDPAMSWLGARIRWGTHQVGSLGSPGNKSPKDGPYNSENDSWGDLLVFNIGHTGGGLVPIYNFEHSQLPYNKYHHWAILGDEIWSGTINLLGDVVVLPGAELTINAGTTIVFPSQFDRHQFKEGNNSLSEIFVYGTLRSEGASDNQVVFRGPDLSDLAQHWGGIRMMSGSSEDVSHTQIRNAPVPTIRPTNLTAEAGNGQATLRWAEPSPSDPSVTGWGYRTKPESATQWGSWTSVSGRGTREALVSPLAYGVRHQFEVRAVNTTGGAPAVEASVALMTVAFSAGQYTLIESGNPVGPEEVSGQAPDPTQAAKEVAVVVQVTPATDRGLTIPVTVTAGSAQAADYLVGDLPSSGLSLTAGQVSARFTVTAQSDEDLEDETIQVGFGTPLPVGVQAGEPASATITLYDTPGAPTGLTAQAGNESVTLRWDDAGNPGIEGWQYQVRRGTIGLWSTWKRMDGAAASATEHTVDEGLENGVSYWFKVRAFNARGRGDESTPVEANPTGFGAVEGVAASLDAGTGVVTLSWTNNPGQYPAGTTWQYWKKEGTTEGRWQDIPGSDASTAEYEVPGCLDSGVNYEFKVQAVYSSQTSESDPVQVVRVRPTPDGLSAQRVLPAVLIENDVMLSWTDPCDAAITKWEYQVKEASSAWGSSWPEASGSASAVSTLVEDLKPYTTYQFKVRARYGSGATDIGPESAVVELSPWVLFAQAPALAARGGDGKVLFEVGWDFPIGIDLPENLVGNENLQVSVETVTATGETTTSDFLPLTELQTIVPGATLETAPFPDLPPVEGGASGDAGSGGQSASLRVVAFIPVSGLDPAVTYRFRVRLVHPDGVTELEPASASVYGLRWQRPTATAVALSWTDPNKPFIRTWQYRQRAGSGSWELWQNVSDPGATTTTHPVSGLEAEETYEFQVQALVPGGPLAESFTVSAPPKPLVEPGNLHAVPGHASMTLRWDDPNNARITGWQYRQRQAGEDWGVWQPIPGSTASTTSYTVTDLTNGVSYRFRVRGVASNGRVVLAWPMVETSPDGSLAVRPPAPVTNGPPEITSGPSAVSFSENGAGTVATYAGTDPDNDPLTWTLGGADADTMRLDASGRLFFRAPPPDFESPGDMNGDKIYEVTVSLSDGRPDAAADTTVSVRVSVTDVNEASVVSGVSDTTFAEKGSGVVATYTWESVFDGS